MDATDVSRRIELLNSFENAGLGWFWATDAQGRLIYLSDHAQQRLGWKTEDVMGKPLTELLRIDQSDDPARPTRPLAFFFGARNTVSELQVRVATTKTEMWWEIAGTPQFDSQQRFTGYRGSAKDVTESRKTQRDAERLAEYDPVTGLANRNRMTKLLSATLEEYRNTKRSCALLTLDLERFKQVNDTLGHQAGDDLLKQVASRIDRIIGNKGQVCRLGGDDFQIMLPDIDDRGELGELAQRLIQMISQPYSVNGARAIIGTAIGMAIAPYDGLHTDELAQAADLALFAAKGDGTGQYRFYSSDLKDGAKNRRQIEEDLRDALENGELAIQYQPIVSATTQMIHCMEALMRWEHPKRGSISPGVFIPIAEEIGLINKLGDWALNQVCLQAQAWPADLRVAVNISAIQVANDDFTQMVQRALKNSGLKPDRLELELTESVFLGDTGRAQKMFLELKDLGVRLALDDFGTGYSSLSYLRTAPFDKIKIDQSFVRGATDEDNNNAAILSAIIGLADALNMETVAEGVETKDELSLVSELGASHVQGFIFSRAIPQEDVVARLERNDLKYEARGPAKYRAERKSVFRRIGLIHEDQLYRVVLRNLSKTGAMIEGLLDVPIGSEVVLDLGGGQLAVATVRRSEKHTQGVEFETSLISDGSNGLCTRHRVSPYDIEAAGRPLTSLPQDPYALIASEQTRVAQRKKFVEVEIATLRDCANL